MDIPRRNIVREQEFEEQLIALLVNEEEADQFTEAAEILLATYPDAGLPASKDGSIWYLPMNTVRGNRVSLFYTFDENAVVFLAILPSED